MDPLNKEPKIRVEAPPQDPTEILGEKFPKFHFLLLIVSLMSCGLSLYLSFKDYLNFLKF